MGRKSRRLSVLAAPLVAAAVLAGCGGTAGYQDPSPEPGPGWAHPAGTARGGLALAEAGPQTLEHRWERSFGAPIIGTAAVTADRQIVVRLDDSAPCTLAALAAETGRRQWCATVEPGPAGASATADDRVDVYVGRPGAVLSYTFLGAPRWQTPVIGAAQPPLILGDDTVLVVTHLGQVSVLDTQHGRKSAPSLPLVGTAPMPDPAIGLADCRSAGPQCAVPYAPVTGPGADAVHLVLREPGSAAPVLVTVAFDPDPDEFGQGRIVERWRSDAVPGGPAAAPALSADGKTLYVLGDGGSTLAALDAGDGALRWRHRLTVPAVGAPTVTADGLIVLTGADDGALIAVRPGPGGAEQTWTRTDLAVAGPVTAAGDTGYVLTESGGELTMTVLDLADGSTITEAAVPDSDTAGGPGVVDAPDGSFGAGVAVPIDTDAVAVVLSGGAVHLFGR